MEIGACRGVVDNNLENSGNEFNDGYETPPHLEGPPKSKKSKKRTQKNRKEWEAKPEFSPWLKADKNDSTKAKCTYCNISFLAQLQVIKNHESGKKHTDRVKDARSISKNMATFVTQNHDQISTRDAVKRAEIKICGFLVEHKLAFQSVDHLTELMKSCFPDSIIAQEIKLKRTKATCLSTNVIGASYKEQLVSLLKKIKFSVMIDESTDISTVKTTCIVVRFNDEKSGKIVSKYFGLVQIEPSPETGKVTADNIFKSIKKEFELESINLENIIGFGSDGCNTMMGAHDSVSSRFKQYCPRIFLMKCICHSLALCASEACKKLPRRCEDLARNIFNFLKHSQKRQAELKQFQEILDVPVHKILHPSQTRWLSLIGVVNRILEQWEALKFLFLNMWNREKLIAAEEIHKSLHDPSIKLYFTFLQWVLPKFTGLNEYFQTAKVVLTTLHDKYVTSYKDLLITFLDRQYVNSTDLNELDVTNKSKFIPLHQLYLGVNVLTELSNPRLQSRPDFQEIQTEFLNRCREFLIEGCQQMRKRYNFNDPVLSKISVLAPVNVLEGRTPSLLPLATQLPRIIAKDHLQMLDDQFRYLSICDIPDEVKSVKEVDVFWNKVLQMKDTIGKNQFDIVGNFALAVLSLPHSNADCERVFSKVNLTKTKTRNKLITSTINGTLLSSQCVGEAGSCVNFEPTKDMLRRFNIEMYKLNDSSQIDNTEDLEVTFDI